jgi:hypothetical protein
MWQCSKHFPSVEIWLRRLPAPVVLGPVPASCCRYQARLPPSSHAKWRPISGCPPHPHASIKGSHRPSPLPSFPLFFFLPSAHASSPHRSSLSSRPQPVAGVPLPLPPIFPSTVGSHSRSSPSTSTSPVSSPVTPRAVGAPQGRCQPPGHAAVPDRFSASPPPTIYGEPRQPPPFSMPPWGPTGARQPHLVTGSSPQRRR